MADPHARLELVLELITDPVADLKFKERFAAVYHAVAYEVLEFRMLRLDARRRRHGTQLNDAIRIATFKHELQKL